MRIDAGNGGKYCDGLSRRNFVQVGVAGMASATMADVLRAKEAVDPANKKSAILLWLDGGPSHMDMYDMKPEAPAEYRGIWEPINTNVSGIQITELFPRQAKIADKFAILRSLHHGTGDHFAGGHRMLTAKNLGVSGANNKGKFPSLGSIVARQKGPNRRGMPAYVSVPVASSIGLRPGYFAGNWMGTQYDPFQTGGNPNAKNFKVNNLALSKGLTVQRLQDRRNLAKSLDALARNVDNRRSFATVDQFDEDAFNFVSGKEARDAFDINQESAKIRDMYGRTTQGQSTLLARRLVEAGATFVTVHFGGWDHHWNLKGGYQNYLPIVDASVAGLITDLDQRGLLDTTLVMLCGEFSRTPRMNTGHNGKGTPGRDHWGSSTFCFLAGGGIKGGQVVGSTDAKGTRPHTRAVVPSNLHATVYRLLGMDPKLHLLDHGGRPVPVLDDPEPIHELI